MIYTVLLSRKVHFILDDFFESYQGTIQNNDMQHRAFIYSRILSCLAHFEAYQDEAYCINQRNYLNIDDSCIVEFAKENDVVLVKDLVFL